MRALVLIVAAAGAAALDGGSLIGNGRLTAVVDEFGRGSVCRWPGPAMNDQLGDGGFGWGIRVDGKIAWLADVCAVEPVEPWMPAVCATNLKFADGASGMQLTFAAFEDDVLVSRMKLFDLNEPPELVWHADFSPRARVLPELACVEGLARVDFAAYASDSRVYQFRPLNPGSKDWAAAAMGDWEAFEKSEGVWVVCGSREAVRATCGLGGQDSAVGDCESAIWMRGAQLGNAYTCTVFAAFGATRAEAEEALERAMTADFKTDSLDPPLLRAAGPWAKFTNKDGLGDRSRKDLATVGMAIDRATGAFTRDPAGGLTSALCYMRDCAWASLALDLYGHNESAANVLRFVASCVRKEQRRGKPLGSLPLAAYGDGTEALPHLALDADAPAYALGAMWRHAAGIEDEKARGKFIDSVWEAAALMADFLAGWTDGRTREPLYSFDISRWRDQQRDGRLLTTYMGVDAALRLAQASGRPQDEEWARRKVELDALIRFQLVDRQERTWKSADILPYWHNLMAEDWARRGSPLPSWDAALEQWLAEPSADASEAAAAAALVWRGQTERAADIAAAVGRAFGSARAFDALGAAQRLVASALTD